MQVGASYYPEVLSLTEWARDLATGREVGLSCLRCGEFAWSALAPDRELRRWETGWARDMRPPAGSKMHYRVEVQDQ
jgi:beta-galactosidase GanA